MENKINIVFSESNNLIVRNLIFEKIGSREEQSFSSLEDIFMKRANGRRVRNELFGTWLTETKDGETLSPDYLIEKIDSKIEEFRFYIENLSKLKVVAVDEAKQFRTHQMMNKVKDMSSEDLEALLKAIKIRQSS